MQPLMEYRQRLNLLDEQLIELLGRRYAICREVAHFKREHSVPMMQPSRVTEVKERVTQIALRYNINPQFVRA